MNPRNSPFPVLPLRQGFALVSVLAILALLLILVLAISSVMHVETRSSASGKNLLLARQNALLGLDTAIGQLQEYAGKDQAVTFPATTFYPNDSPLAAKNPASTSSDSIWKLYRDAAATTDDNGAFFGYANTWLTPAERDAFETSVRNWWSTKNPRWTGILDTSLRRDSSAVDSDQFGEPKRNQLPIWLVSGNEKFTIDQNADTAYPSGYQTPDTILGDPDADPTVVYLVEDGSAGRPTGDADIGNDINGDGTPDIVGSSDGFDGRVKVTKQKVEAAPTSGNATITTGHYAYWVGDESTKANFGARDKTSQNDATYPNDIPNNSITYRNRLQSPQRVGWDNVAGLEPQSRGGSSTFGINDLKLENISTSKEIGLLENTNTAAIKNAAIENFHNLTAFSKSLLTDTALGGLRKDLTPYITASGPLPGAATIMDPAKYSSSDPRFGPSNAGFPGSTSNIPEWLELKSWYNTSSNTGGSIAVSPAHAPVLANYQLFFALTHDGTGRVQFHMVPTVTLWNPYDVALQNTNYTLKWRHNFGMWRMGFAVENAAYVDPDPAVDTDGKKIGNYFVSPLTPLDWYVSGQKNFGTQFTTLWGASGTNTPSYRFSPFDRGSGVFAAPPAPDSNDATYVNYTFTASFAPGEVKIFTVASMQKINAPSALHPPTQSQPPAETVALTNDFDPDFPNSFYFDFASGLSKGPIGAVAANTDTVRWYAERLSGSSPSLSSMELLAGGTRLWRNYSLGAPGDWSRNLDRTSDAGNNSPVSIAPDSPAGWRRLYDLTTWQGLTKGQNKRELTAPLIAMFRGRVDPFAVQGWQTFNNGQLTHGTPQNRYRAFATHNLSASTIDPMFRVEFSRQGVAGNNSDLFPATYGVLADPNSTQLTWDADQADFSSGNARGFALLGWKDVDATLGNQGQSLLSVRSVRRPNANVLSLGQFQQANVSPFFWQPSFPIGNSEASPYVDRARVAGLNSYSMGAATGNFAIWQPAPRSSASTLPNNAANELVDLSYLLNESLWDSYFLSSIPQSGALALDNSTPLPNSRLRFDSSLNPSTSDVRDPETAAAFLTNIGALNVNSTSVEAWKALLTAFRDLRIQGASDDNPDETVPIARTLDPLGDPVNFTSTASDNTPADYGAVTTNRNYSKLFNGFRYLTDAMIQSLAERIVDEVQLRGPFFSLSDFVNRRLVAPDNTGGVWTSAREKNTSSNTIQYPGLIGSSYDPLVGLTGINGALQRAINVSGVNGGVNYPVSLDVNDRVFRMDLDLTSADNAGVVGSPMSIYSATAWYLDSEHVAGAPAGEAGQLLSHAPGFVTQGDLLAMIGPALTPRGDTFLVRSYGDATDSTGDKVLSRAYLEAVVQRMPEPVTAAGTSGDDQWRYTDKFGRKFKVVKLRWLNPEEL